jgi:hypothetical protein
MGSATLFVPMGPRSTRPLDADADATAPEDEPEGEGSSESPRRHADSDAAATSTAREEPRSTTPRGCQRSGRAPSLSGRRPRPRDACSVLPGLGLLGVAMSSIRRPIPDRRVLAALGFVASLGFGRAAQAESTAGTFPTDSPDTPNADPTDAPPSASAEPAATSSPGIVEVLVGPSVGVRSLRYSDGITENLRDYSIAGAPSVAGSFEVRPFATLDVPGLSWVGITFEGRVALAVASALEGGDKLATSWSRIAGGLRLRVPIGEPAAIELGASSSIVFDDFAIEAPARLAGEVPSASTLALTGGLDGRVPLGPIALLASAAYLGTLDFDGIYSRFREPTVRGVELGGGLAVPIALGFEVRAMAEYTRWFSSFEPAVGDDFVAGGALDEQVQVQVGGAYAY